MATTRSAEARMKPKRNAKGQLAAQKNIPVENIPKSAEGNIKNFKGDSRTATGAQRQEASIAKATRTRSQQAYDIKRAYGVSVG